MRIFAFACWVSREKLFLTVSLSVLLMAACVPVRTVHDKDLISNLNGKQKDPKLELHSSDSEKPNTDAYFTMLNRFNSANIEQRNIIYEQTTLETALKSNAHHRLQLALLKLSPGHNGYDPHAAEILLRSIINDSKQLPVETVNMASVYLQMIVANNNLRSVNEQLTQDLAKTREKLDALTKIEKAIESPIGDDLDKTVNDNTSGFK